MRICVFGAASANIDEKYIKVVEKLGEEMARRGHSLVFGAGSTGLMGAVARGLAREDGYMHGIVPVFFRNEDVEQLYVTCDLVTYTETMYERKFLMEREADAYLILPGGVGTFDEFFEVLTLKQLGRHNRAIAVLNIDGYYDDLEKFMRSVTEKKFITADCKELYTYVHDVDECLDYLENYVPTEFSMAKRKRGD